VHTHIADHGSTFAIYKHNTHAAAECTTETVGITDGDCGNRHVLCCSSFSSVADRFTRGNLPELRDHRLQRGNRLEIGGLLVGGIDSVKPDAQPYHLELELWEPEDPRRIQNMSHGTHL